MFYISTLGCQRALQFVLSSWALGCRASYLKYLFYLSSTTLNYRCALQFVLSFILYPSFTGTSQFCLVLPHLPDLLIYALIFVLSFLLYPGLQVYLTVLFIYQSSSALGYKSKRCLTEDFPRGSYVLYTNQADDPLSYLL